MSNATDDRRKQKNSNKDATITKKNDTSKKYETEKKSVTNTYAYDPDYANELIRLTDAKNAADTQVTFLAAAAADADADAPDAADADAADAAAEAARMNVLLVAAKSAAAEAAAKLAKANEKYAADTEKKVEEAKTKANKAKVKMENAKKQADTYSDNDEKTKRAKEELKAAIDRDISPFDTSYLDDLFYDIMQEKEIDPKVAIQFLKSFEYAEKTHPEKLTIQKKNRKYLLNKFKQSVSENYVDYDIYNFFDMFFPKVDFTGKTTLPTNIDNTLVDTSEKLITYMYAEPVDNDTLKDMKDPRHLQANNPYGFDYTVSRKNQKNIALSEMIGIDMWLMILNQSGSNTNYLEDYYGDEKTKKPAPVHTSTYTTKRTSNNYNEYKINNFTTATHK